MNASHQIGKLKNRLKRLKKKVAAAGADRQGNMTSRVSEIEEILRKNKV
jgi:hypothetical protein